MTDMRFVPLARAVRALQLPQTRVVAMIDAGDLDAERRGGTWLVARASLEALLRAHRRSA